MLNGDVLACHDHVHGSGDAASVRPPAMPGSVTVMSIAIIRRRYRKDAVLSSGSGSKLCHITASLQYMIFGIACPMYGLRPKTGRCCDFSEYRDDHSGHQA